MNTPVHPAGTAAPLHLYDYTHGQRRLTLWRESDARGAVYTLASVAVPVTTQAPGEPPEIEWVTVATACANAPQIALASVATHDAVLIVAGAGFPLYRDEADAIGAYLGLPALPGEDEA